MHLTKRIFKGGGTIGATAALGALSVAGLAALGAAPASASATTLNMTYAIPVLGGYAQETTAITGSAPANAVTGSNFTVSITAAPFTTPTAETVAGVAATVNFFQGIQTMMPIPANATYVSSALSSTSATWSGGSVPFTQMYCTAAATGCTATPHSATFGGSTSTPYLELATPGYGSTVVTADEIPAGVTVTFPTVSVVFHATGAAGSTVQPAVSEFDTAGDATVPSFGITLLEPVATWPTAVLTTAQEASGQLAPPALVTPLSTTTITAPPPPAPTVTAVSPSSGLTTGGTSITITGTGFVSGATVKVGSAAATAVTVNSATSITATTPSGSAGVANVVVTDSSGTSATSSADDYTYTAPPPPTTTTTTTPPSSTTTTSTPTTNAPMGAIGGVLLAGVLGGGFFAFEQRRRRHAAQKS